MDLYNSYYSLADLITTADSVIYRGEKINVYSRGGRTAYLYEVDSCIVVKAGIKSDTLFLRAFFDLAEAEIDEPLDSLVVCTTHNGENIRFSFMTDTPVEVRILETVRDQESNYRYE